MTRTSPYTLMLLGIGASVSAMAQTDFKATLTTVATAEGGSEVVLVVDTDNERFSLQVPQGLRFTGVSGYAHDRFHIHISGQRHDRSLYHQLSWKASGAGQTPG